MANSVANPKVSLVITYLSVVLLSCIVQIWLFSVCQSKKSFLLTEVTRALVGLAINISFFVLKKICWPGESCQANFVTALLSDVIICQVNFLSAVDIMKILSLVVEWHIHL